MTDSAPPTAAGDRLAKVMARAGLCSRRDAEAWIKAGRVTVNGRKIMTPAFNVASSDQIVVDGTPLAARAGTRVWLYHKPKGLVVTEKDPEGRPTIFETLEKEGLPRVVSVGRLDINTEGLLLLTNDGGLKRVLELPATGWLRKYRVRAHGTITQPQLDALKAGISVDGVEYAPIEATLERDQGANVWLELALREGKNREVKNILMALGLEVNRLIRISFGPFQLGDIPVGGVEVVKARVLKEQLGRKLADKAEVDFDSEMPERTPPASRRGAPPAERTYGRGTHTTTIAKERFRFTDRAELTPEQAAERRTARPRQDRPGAGAGPRRPPPARAREPEGGPVRKIHFDDGRETVFEEKTYGKKPKPGDAKFARGGPGAKPAGPARFAGKPRPAAADAARPARPYKPRAEGDAARPTRAYKPRAEGDAARPARSYKPRADGDAPRPPRPFKPRVEGDAPRPPRAFKPRAEDDARPPRPRKPGAATTGAEARISRKAGSGKPRPPRPTGAGKPARPLGKGGPPRRPTRPPEK